MNLPPNLLLILFVLSTHLCGDAFATEKKPLKIFILVGQSNMEGHARVETFDYIGDDPATAPLLKMMRGDDGKPTVCDGAWISYFTGAANGSSNGEGFGKITAGYGSRSTPDKDGGKIGPEFTFGLTMDAAFEGPVLILKTAWGGKSLHTDFCPPSAGPYQLNDYQKNLYYGPPGHGVPKDMEHRTPEILEVFTPYGAEAQRIIPHLRETAEMFEKGETNFPIHLSKQKAKAVREAIAKIEASVAHPELKRL